MIAIAKNKYQTNVKPRLTDVTEWVSHGVIKRDIAYNLGIAYSTFNEYKDKYLELSEALKKGEEIADEKIENALFKKAMGYEITEETTDIKEVNGTKTVHMKKTKKHIAGDVTAQIFYLKNRAKSRWKDKPDEDFDNNVNITIKGI